MTWRQLVELAEEPLMHLKTIYSTNEFIGFVIYWHLNTWLYIEHLAIKPEQRSKGFGQQVVRELIKFTTGNIVLEMELPANKQSIRRIRFYERLGFNKVDRKYLQPPYRKDEKPFPMLLMTFKPFKDLYEYEQLITMIRHEVYEKFY